MLRGHLRGAAPVGTGIIIARVAYRYALYRLIERLHSGNRAVNQWFLERAKVIDQRDTTRHQQLSAIAEDVALIGRGFAEEVARIRTDLTSLAEKIGYTNGSIRTFVGRSQASASASPP